MRKLSLTLGLLLLSLPVWAKKPALTFEQEAVSASVSRGARTAWLIVAHQTHDGTMTIHDGAFILNDDDGDGIVRYPLGNIAVSNSVWMVVDLQDGSYTVDAPQTKALRRQTIPPGAFHSRGNAGFARFEQEGMFTLFLLVRPGVGAWMAKVRDGVANDADGTFDRRLMARLDAMTPLGDSPAAPDDFNRDDVIGIADVLTMAILDGRVVK